MAESKSSVSKYSLYDGREIAGPAVNWGKVAADTTAVLGAISKDRATRKQKIEDDTAEAMNQLAQVELGASTNMNTVILDGSAASKNTLSNAYDMVKRGLMSPKDFAMAMQKQKDGYTNLSTWAKSYNNEYEIALERVNSGEAAGIEEAMRLSSFKFGNMTNKKLMSDPLSGELVMVDLIENDNGEYVVPNYMDNPANYSTPQQLLNNSKYVQNSLNLKEDVSKYVTANLASVVVGSMTEYSKGSGGNAITSIKDFRQLFEEIKGTNAGGKFTDEDGVKIGFDDWMTTQAEGLMATDVEKAEYGVKNGLFSFVEGTRPAGDNDQSKIYWTAGAGLEPKYELTEGQRQSAINLGRNEINAQLDLEIEKQKGLSGSYAPQDPVGNRIKAKEKAEEEKTLSYLEQINTLLTGNLTDANNEARDLIADYNSSLSPEDLKEKGIRGIVVTKNTIRVKPIKGEEYEVQRFSVDTDDQGVETRIQREVSEDAVGLFNRIVSEKSRNGKTLTKKQLKEYIDGEKIEFGNVREESLSFRDKQTKIDNSLIQRGPSTALGDKDPYGYIADVFGGTDATSAYQSMEKLEETTSKVIGAMIPPSIMTVLESSGYKNPLTTIVMDDDADTITFKVGEEEVLLDFSVSQSPTYMYDAINNAIKGAIEKLNVTRRRGDLDTQMKYDEWKVDIGTTEKPGKNPTGDQTLAGYYNWLLNNTN